MSSLTANLSQPVNPPMQTSLLGQPPALLQQPIRTDFSNLFPEATTTVSTNSSAMAIAAAKARELLRAKNLSIAEKNNVENASASNGNSNNDGELL